MVIGVHKKVPVETTLLELRKDTMFWWREVFRDRPSPTSNAWWNYDKTDQWTNKENKGNGKGKHDKNKGGGALAIEDKRNNDYNDSHWHGQ